MGTQAGLVPFNTSFSLDITFKAEPDPGVKCPTGWYPFHNAPGWRIHSVEPNSDISIQVIQDDPLEDYIIRATFADIGTWSITAGRQWYGYCAKDGTTDEFCCDQVQDFLYNVTASVNEDEYGNRRWECHSSSASCCCARVASDCPNCEKLAAANRGR